MIRLLFVFLVVSLLMTSAPVTTAGQTGTPIPRPLAACTVTPRTPEELETLLGSNYVPPAATPFAVQATPGGEWIIGIEALPDGTPADSTEVEAVVEEAYACFAAGDFMRYLALFSDDEILQSRGLSGIGMAMATPDLRTPTSVDRASLPHQTRGLFHARLLPDGRMAAVSPLGFIGLPELYLFVREGDRWLIDDIVPLGSEYASASGDRNTFTGSKYVPSGLAEFVTYGWGLEFGPEWTPVINPESNTVGVAVLTNGVSFVVVGIPGATPGSDLTACAQPKPRDLAASLKNLGLKPIINAVRQGLEPAMTADNAPIQGADEQRAFAVYNLAGSAGGNVAADEPMRLYVECRTMAGGDWILGITHFTPAADYETEAAKRDALLASLEDWNPTQEPIN